MGSTPVREAAILAIINGAYAAADDGEMMQAVFASLRELFPFNSGVFMPVNPTTLELQSGICFDCRSADMNSYLTHYAALDPFVQRQHGPALLNKAVLMSDLISDGDLARSPFSDFQRQVPYRHELGMLTGVANQAIATFSVHRWRGESDFTRAEKALLNAIGPHLARAVVLRRLARDPRQLAETGIAVFTRAERTLYLNAAAQRYLGNTSAPEVLAVVAASGHGTLRVGSRFLRLATVPWSAASLLRAFSLHAHAALPAGDGQSAIQVGQREGLELASPTVIVSVRPFSARTDMSRRLALYSLSPRQSEIAAWALRGLTNTEIADQIHIGAQTVKDHFQEIYCRVGVHSRSELLAKVLGTNSSVLPARRAGGR